MGAIKCLCDGLTQRSALRILDKHVRPGERLDCNPMQPDRAAKRTNRSNATDPPKHVARLGLANFGVNHRFVPALGTKAPLPSSRYLVEPTRRTFIDCCQVPAAKSFLASIAFVSASFQVGTFSTLTIASDKTLPSIFCGALIPRMCRIVGAISTLPVGKSSV